MKLTFYGGAKNVTGANYLLESGGYKMLIDCGLMQGSHYAETQNFLDFPYHPAEMQTLIVTHAHLDHIGRIPKLYQNGFRGKIYSTPPTRDFAEVSLLDSEHILGKEAEREQKPNFCTTENIEGAMGLWEGVKYHHSFAAGPFTITFYDAGHILGSAFAVIEVEGKKIVFSGDLGNYPAPIVRPTEEIPTDADYCVIESAYGNRAHEDTERRQEMLEDIIEEAVRNKGTLLIPVFALERTQEVLYYLHQLFEQGRVPRVPVFVDSPLAIKLTAIYRKYEDYFNTDVHAHAVRSGDDIMNFPGLRLTLTTEESKAINGVPPPKVILAGSGMSQGGRIIHHESRYLAGPENTILFVGYQTRGSLGREIQEGMREIRIFGETVPVRCRVRSITGFSAHADQPRLFNWIKPARLKLTKIFVVQGDEESSDELARKFIDELAVESVVPDEGYETKL